MSRSDHLELDGVVTNVYAGGNFNVKTDAGAEIRANNTLLKNLAVKQMAGLEVRQDGDVVRVEGVEVEDVETTAKTLPGFENLWSEMLSPKQGSGN